MIATALGAPWAAVLEVQPRNRMRSRPMTARLPVLAPRPVVPQPRVYAGMSVRPLPTVPHYDPTNISELRSLPDIGTKRVDINAYPELLNEPYSYEPNDYRPELRVVRRHFTFGIGTDKRARMNRNEIRPTKAETNCSVLNIYDTYGLDVTYAFLDHIYHTKLYRAHPDWLLVYLESSFSHITGTSLPYIADPAHSAYRTITSILLELALIDDRTFKPDYELQPMSLLPELVARITMSRRVSKEVSMTVRLLAIPC